MKNTKKKKMTKNTKIEKMIFREKEKCNLNVIIKNAKNLVDII